ncbi:hypothetical protein PR048_018279, partial [Dryococelus australis]
MVPVSHTNTVQLTGQEHSIWNFYSTLVEDAPIVDNSELSATTEVDSYLREPAMPPDTDVPLLIPEAEGSHLEVSAYFAIYSFFRETFQFSVKK